MNRLVAVPAAGRPELHAFSATNLTRGERLFRRAARHSRFIRVLRVAIPVTVVAVLGLIVAAAYFNPFKTPANLALDKGKPVVSGTKVAMEQPRLTGFTSDMLPYELTAQLASHDLRQPGVLELKDLKAQIRTKDQGTITISAESGFYTVKADQLRLVDNILVKSSLDYEARLQEAVVDMKKGTIVSERRVATRFPKGTIEANHLNVSDGGSVVVFSQGVETILILDTPQTGPSKTPAR
jgi:lipopolysaccharide export system protein LptC